MENNNTHNLMHNLKYVGNNNMPISNYYITDDSNVLKEQDGKGNVIIYTSDDSTVGAVDNDFIKTQYTDLYIGDEHIAGGFGFKNINDREYTYSYVTNNYNEIIQLKEDIEYTKENIDNIIKNVENISSSTLTVNKNSDYFYVDNTKYVIDIIDNKLNIQNKTSFDISDVKLYFDIYAIIDNVEQVLSVNNYISLFNKESIILPCDYNIKLTKLTCTFKHSAIINNWSLYYTITTNNIGTSKISNNIYITGDELSNYKISFDNDDSNKIYKVFEYDTNYATNNMYNGKYIIELPDSDDYKLIGDNVIHDIDFYFMLYDQNNNSINISLPKIKFVPYIYYSISSEQYVNNIHVEDLKQTAILINNDINHNIDLIYDFNKNTSEKKYYCILLPTYYAPINSNITFTLKRQHDITIKWENTGIKYTINNIEYILYRTPCMYSGEMHWVINL